MPFVTQSIEKLPENAVQIIGHDAMLITAGTARSFNTMTAAWGGLGFLWKKPVSFIFIRPQRFTFQFAEKNDYYSLSFFSHDYAEILDYCGNHSGKDVDKIKKTGLKVLETERGTIYFEQARLVLECRKLYAEFLNPDHFIDKSILKMYPIQDYHKFYVGEIVQCLVRA